MEIYIKNNRNKKISVVFISIVSLFIFSIGTVLVHAQESDPLADLRAQREAVQTDRQTNQEEASAQRAANLDNLRENREVSQTERQTAVSDRKAALTESATTRIKNLAANISNRLDALVARLEQITSRIEARADKLSELGVDTTAAKQYLEDARGHLATAKSLLSDIDQRVAAVTGGNDPRAAWSAGKEIFQSIKAELQAVQQTLRASVAALKEAVAAAREDTASDNSTLNITE